MIKITTATFLYGLAFWLLVAPSQAFSEQIQKITGRILTEQQHAIAGSKIVINGQQTASKKDGSFSIEIPKNDSYQLAISKPGFYSSVQTFSHYELSHAVANFAINDILLVAKKKSRVMLAFTGDAMMGRRYYKPYFGDEVLINEQSRAQDSKAIVKLVKPYLSQADYALVNLETQVAPSKPSERAKKSVTFYSHPDTLSALAWAGVDYVTLGNNHTYDYLEQGLKSTLDALKQSELDYSGAGIDETSALEPHIEKINNQTFALLGYNGWTGSKKPTQTATESHGGPALGSMKNIKSSVTKAKQNNAIPIVQYHGGLEYKDQPTIVTEQRLKSALDHGAALAVAHHPHVAQGLELYNNKLIAYSMGNFIFDQNFSATQHSFILYVWLDEGKFHRAEIVPIYVKGYRPTPATGQHRQQLLSRLSWLSAQRSTTLYPTGGHAFISSKTPLEAKESSTPLTKSKQNSVRNIGLINWFERAEFINSLSNDIPYRLGVNLVNGSDFESFNSLKIKERGFVYDRSTTQLTSQGFSGDKSLQLQVSNQQSTWFGMQSFRRVYQPDSPMTVAAQLKISKPVTVNVYWQGRKTRQKLFDAFKNSPKQHIATFKLAASDNWQPLTAQFNSPRVGYKSYRVLVEFINEDKEKTLVNIDDFALIEWQTAFATQHNFQSSSSALHQASFIEFLQ